MGYLYDLTDNESVVDIKLVSCTSTLQSSNPLLRFGLSFQLPTYSGVYVHPPSFAVSTNTLVPSHSVG